MNPNIPKQPYGYLPPKLGGEGMGERQKDGDLMWFKQKWQPCGLEGLKFLSNNYYTRPIDPEEGYIILDTNETVTQESEYFNGTEWVSAHCCAGLTVKEFIEAHPAWIVLAIRTRIETPKEPEWPRYWEANGVITRKTSTDSIFEAFNSISGHWHQTLLSSIDKPSTPTQAEAIMRGDKTPTFNEVEYKEYVEQFGKFLRKEGDEKCATVTPVLSNQTHNASQASEVTKEAKNFDWSKEEAIAEQYLNPKPNWRPIAECDLKPGEAFYYAVWNPIEYHYEIVLNRFGDNYPHNWLSNMKATHFLRCEGIYQIPLPPEPKRLFCVICGLDSEDHELFKVKLNHPFTK